MPRELGVIEAFAVFNRDIYMGRIDSLPYPRRIHSTTREYYSCHISISKPFASSFSMSSWPPPTMERTLRNLGSSTNISLPVIKATCSLAVSGSRKLILMRSMAPSLEVFGLTCIPYIYTLCLYILQV